MQIKILTYAFLLLALPVFARDPFWPLGYNPAPPPPPKPKPAPAALGFGAKGILTNAVPAAARAPEEAPDKPAAPKPGDPGFFSFLFGTQASTTNQWATAKKRLSIDGFMSSYSSAGKQQESIVMINRLPFRNGDTLVLTNNAIRFSWKVVLPDQKHFRLDQIEAVEIKSDSKKEKK